VEFVRQLFARLQRNLWLPALVGRLAMAGEFIPSGFGKVTHPSRLTANFVELGIPAPALTAAVSATTELVCGVLLLVGLGTRVAAAALTVVMTVAILTARVPDVHGLGDFFYLPETAYIVIFLWIIFGGAGAVSVDHWIDHWIQGRRDRPTRGPTGRAAFPDTLARGAGRAYVSARR
jgi:putative oxidoreductase